MKNFVVYMIKAAALGSVFDAIWRARNQQVFEGVTPNLGVICKQVTSSLLIQLQIRNKIQNNRMVRKISDGLQHI